MENMDRATEAITRHDISLRWVIFSLPILSALSSFVACLLAYIIGVNSGALQPLPFVPFISDTGNFKPSSSVFTLFLLISCFVSLFIIVIRYFQVAAENRCLRANRVAVVCGFLFILGKVVVSSFQLSSHIVVHFGAAGLYFLGATVYAIIQTYISKVLYGKMTKETVLLNFERKKKIVVFLCRVLCCIGLVLNLVIFGVFATVPSLNVHNRNGANVAQGTEWALAAFKIMFLLTFLEDFWNIEFTFSIKFEAVSRMSINQKAADEEIATFDGSDGINFSKYRRFDSNNGENKNGR